MPAYDANFLPEGVSDHCLVVISLLDGPRRVKPAFKYCNVWASHPEFLNIVKKTRDHNIEGHQMFRVVKRLKYLERRLRNLNSQHFRNIITEADEDRIELAKAQEELHLQPMDKTLQEQKKRLYQKFMRSSYMAEIYLQQKSKATWIKLGDYNTRYFFSIIKYRKLKQTILQLKDNNDVMQTNQKAVADVFVEYYEDLLGTKEKKRQRAKVKSAMFGIDINKSPGSDGYGSGFFRAAWTVIGQDVTQAILEFMEMGELLT
ncbi:hypothetical protein KY285_007028 [Solanum tuberosum]|nr:hypothetical protein KY285_007028 [Solanum tuberosum]